MDTNILYYGDNLKILREHIHDSSVDLVYLDPPFNSKATYNVLFKEPTGKPSEAQITAFEDTWRWGIESERTLLEINNSKLLPPSTKDLMNLLSSSLGRNDMMAYLVMMCIRLVELRRVLKETGSIYLHCDPTASHYLKLLMDTIFLPENFRTEIIWKRSSAHSDTKQGRRQHGRIHDVLLFYTKGQDWIWNPIYAEYDPGYVEQFYKYVEPETGRRYRLGDLTGPGGAAKGNPSYDVMGVTRYWRYSRERMEELIKEGRIVQSSPGTVPAYKRYLDEMLGVPLQDVWTDIGPIAAQAAERLGYPTQKPSALLERIIQASSNEGDVVLDPFCGCGTALIAAQKLNRKWIGIDITHLSIGIMKWRLDTMFPVIKYKVTGEPEDLEGARELARENKYEFQWWAVSKIGGQPYGDKKKGADTGIDGYLYFTDYSAEKDKVKKAIISVKAGGQVHSSVIRDLGHVIDREKADFGILLTLEEPTQPMVKESATKGFYSSQTGHDYPRIQILTIEQVLQGKKPNIPVWVAPIQAPPTPVKVEGKTRRLL
ncbi:MAG: site-specific DNA-methyltransferase [Dehalococcoidia bacterium]